jgi:uncharacterized damage-inducible protein DinB
MANELPEFWLRGPIEGITPGLQPVAHALLQSRQEVKQALDGFPDELLWVRPAGRASVAFHLQHLTGVCDRLFTYAEGNMLEEEQLVYLKEEGKEREGIDLNNLIDQWSLAVEMALGRLAQWKAEDLLQPREVGRKKLPSTVLGLLFHAAEHSSRHTGQLIVTAAFVKAMREKNGA